MSVKKQVFLMSVLFDTNETYAESAMEAVSHSLYNEEGILEWDTKLISEEELSIYGLDEVNIDIDKD